MANFDLPDDFKLPKNVSMPGPKKQAGLQQQFGDTWYQQIGKTWDSGNGGWGDDGEGEDDGFGQPWGSTENSFQPWNPSYYQQAPNTAGARAEYFKNRPPVGSADWDIFQFESAWEPRFGANLAPGGGSFVQLQDLNRHGWGNAQWQDPLQAPQELQQINARIRELDRILGSPVKINDDKARDQRAAQQRAAWERGDLTRERERLEAESRGRLPDAKYLTELYKPWYEPWYMPRDYSKKVGG